MAKVKLRLSKGAGLARAKFEEAKHKRDTGGKFADKPGAGNDKPAKTADDWQASAKTTGVTGADRIKIHAPSNPKKPGSASAARFDKYEDGITVDGFLKAGGTREDLAWDRKKGFITIHDDAMYTRLSGVSPVAEINPAASGRLAAIKNPEKAAKAEAEQKPTKPPVPKTQEQADAEAAKKAKAEEAAKPKESAATAKAAPKTVEKPLQPSSTSVKQSGDVKPPEAPEGEKVTDIADTSAKPLKVELPKKMPPDHRYKADELTPLPSTSMGDEAEKGLKWEYEVEYIKYGGQNWGPGIKSQDDFNTRYKAAPLTYLSDEQYSNLGYTTINMSKLPTFNDVHKAIGHRRNPAAIQDRMFNGITTPPIVLKKGKSLRLMAGQSRIWTGLASGFRVPVKILDVTNG